MEDGDFGVGRPRIWLAGTRCPERAGAARKSLLFIGRGRQGRALCGAGQCRGGDGERCDSTRGERRASSELRRKVGQAEGFECRTMA